MGARQTKRWSCCLPHAGPSRVMKYGINIPLKPEEYFQEKEAHSSQVQTQPEFNTTTPLCTIQGSVPGLCLKTFTDVGYQKKGFYIIIKNHKLSFLSQTVKQSIYLERTMCSSYNENMNIWPLSDGECLAGHCCSQKQCTQIGNVTKTTAGLPGIWDETMLLVTMAPTHF